MAGAVVPAIIRILGTILVHVTVHLSNNGYARRTITAASNDATGALFEADAGLERYISLDVHLPWRTGFRLPLEKAQWTG